MRKAPKAHLKHGGRHSLAYLLLLLFFAQVVSATTQLSLTSDEGPQLTSAYAYLTTGDPLLIEYDGHPPLAKSVNAIPLLFVSDLGTPAEVEAWGSPDPYSLIWVTQQFFYPYRPLERIVIAPRVMTALLSTVLLAMIYRWAADLFGPGAGLGALFLASFDPNLLAHAGLATNDLAVTAACTAALFACRRFLRRPSGRRAILAGMLLGLAQSTKLNAVLLLPVVGLVLLLHLWRLRRTSSASGLRRRCALVLMLFVTAGLTLWATYGFELRAVAALPFPLPAGSHLLLWERVLKATGGGHPAFLMGEISTDGWWFYFPIAFGIKTPLPTLLIVAAGTALFLISLRRTWRDEGTLWLFILLYGSFTVYSRLNIGYRHLLPVLPLLFIGASRVFSAGSRLPRTRWAVLGPLGLWLVVGTLRIWPFHLSYFNELIGGPDQGYRYLVDSNLDWGQAFKALADYQVAHATGPLWLSTYIEYEAALRGYGIDFVPLPPLHTAPGLLPSRFNPAPGTYAISSTTLQGIFTADPGMYDWFRKREPDAKLGHALFIYHVPGPRVIHAWVAQCTDPVAPLTSQAIVDGFGRDDLRHATFDCTQSWLLPGGGDSPGWYVLSRDTAHRADGFIHAQLDSARLSFEQAQAGYLPPFSIYEATHGAPPPEIAAVHAVQIGDLTLLGHTVHPTKDTIEIWTYWQIDAVPSTAISLMLHLVGSKGAPVLVGDGLGVPQEQWRPGDRIIQRHVLTLPPEAASSAYTPHVGAYALDTLERYPVKIEGQITGDAYVLPALSLPE